MNLIILSKRLDKAIIYICTLGQYDDYRYYRSVNGVWFPMPHALANIQDCSLWYDKGLNRRKMRLAGGRRDSQTHNTIIVQYHTTFAGVIVVFKIVNDLVFEPATQHREC